MDGMDTDAEAAVRHEGADIDYLNVPTQRTPTGDPGSESRPHELPVQIVARPVERPVHAGQTIAAVERALDVLLLFPQLGRGDLGVTEIASELGMSKAAVHRVLSSLRSRGLVVLDPSSHRYSLGASSLTLGHSFLDQLEVRRLALPDMHRLADTMGETVILAVRANDFQIFVEQVRPDQDVRMEVPIGIPMPLHTGGAGRVFLAHFTDLDIDAYIERSEIVALTPLTITDPEALRTEINRVREHGYAITYGERQEGSASVSAAILDDHGRVAAVLTVAGPDYRIADRLMSLVDPLTSTTEALSRRLGWYRLDD